MKWIASVLIVIFVGIGVSWNYYTSFLSTPAGESQVEVTFEVTPGESFASVAKRLSGMRLIKNEKLFSVWAKLSKQREKLKTGEYVLRQSMSPKEIMDILASGKSKGRLFVVSEGLNIYEISILFEKASFGSRSDFLQACFDKNYMKSLLGDEVYSCEGYLFPETYTVDRKTNARTLIKIMTDQFKAIWNLNVNELTLDGWSRDRIVTLASIIEKETGAPEERPLISSVFHNRLLKNMRLQTDPTVLYGILDLTREYRKNITKNDLQTPTKYNTYTAKGLPYGPISNPGLLALKAAVKPAESNYLYFVSKNDGTHTFTETYEDHKKAIGKFQLNPNARQGKSWRDLNKKINQ